MTSVETSFDNRYDSCILDIAIETSKGVQDSKMDSGQRSVGT